MTAPGKEFVARLIPRNPSVMELEPDGIRLEARETFSFDGFRKEDSTFPWVKNPQVNPLGNGSRLVRLPVNLKVNTCGVSRKREEPSLAIKGPTEENQERVCRPYLLHIHTLFLDSSSMSFLFSRS